ncbi:JmjC domain-containing protein [Cynara cardunculus var. scolymus]|uniref:JmjC domain-containing protein n=1 Tax=Cynara cardunculus var. scolymus TaxID=59895 RepID=A0A103Y7B3_CYNCS|nr:JmjC domain-containing protein [Cynara cardunculus var. scolymus]
MFQFSLPIPSPDVNSIAVVDRSAIGSGITSEPSIMPSENKRTKRIDTDEQSNPPAFVSLTSFLLKRVEGNEERGSTQVKPSSQAFDIEKLQKSLKRRPWILHDQINRSEKLDREHLDKNSCVENSPPKGVIHGCSSCNDCQKLNFDWQEFEDTSKYIAKIRPEAEEYGICSIVPPDSWQPYCPIKENKIWENSRFHTHVQRIDELQNPYLKRERRKITEKMNGNRTSMVELNNGSDGFQLESGPDFTLQTFKTYAEDFEACYFQKEGILMDSGTPTWEDIEGEYWRIVTQLSPSILNSEGIPVYRCFQYPHQFVLVFPGAYSSGFNIGFNVSMSVNLAPFDWLPYGEYSVEIYKDLHRKTSISYDKLLIDISRNTVKASWLLKLRRDSEEWKTACGTDGKLNALYRWAEENREIFSNDRDDK